jgi:hypothetical protein
VNTTGGLALVPPALSASELEQGHGGQSDGDQKGARPGARQLSVQGCLLARHPTLAGPTQET